MRITDISREDLCECIIITLRTLLKMRNVSDKGRKENQSTHLMYKKFVLKIVPFMR